MPSEGREIRSPRSRVIGCCEQLHIGAGKPTLVLAKGGECS